MNELKPKAPELLQKIEWLRLYGIKYWKQIIVAILFLSVGPGWYYFYPDVSKKEQSVEINKNHKDSKDTSKPESLSALGIVFIDGSSAYVDISVQAQIDQELLLQSFSLYGSAEAALEALQRSIHGATIAVLEKKSQEFVRTHRYEVAQEIIEMTKDAQERTAYKIKELSILEIH